MVGLCGSGLEDADEGYSDDEEAEGEEGCEACLLFFVDADESEEEMQRESHDFGSGWISQIYWRGQGVESGREFTYSGDHTRYRLRLSSKDCHSTPRRLLAYHSDLRYICQLLDAVASRSISSPNL